MNVNKKSNLYGAVDAHILSDVVKRHFRSGDIENYELLAGGLFNTTYKIQTNGERYVLRIGPVNKHLLMDFEHGMMEAEAHVNGLMKERGIPCQDIIAVDVSHDIVGRDYMIVRFMDAIPLLDDIIPEADRTDIIMNTGRYARMIHEIAGNKYGRVSMVLAGKGFDTWKAYIFDELIRLEKSCKPFGFLSKAEWSSVYSAFTKFDYVLDEIKIPYLNHGDLWAGNLLCAKEHEHGVYKLKAVIDVDRAVFGDTDFDIASGYMISEWFMQGYGRRMGMSEKAQIRRKLYKILFYLIEVYVRGAQYNDIKSRDDNKALAIWDVAALL